MPIHVLLTEQPDPVGQAELSQDTILRRLHDDGDRQHRFRELTPNRNQLPQARMSYFFLRVSRLLQEL